MKVGWSAAELTGGFLHDFICINDPESDVDFETLSARLKAAFETILPEKSSFEI